MAQQYQVTVRVPRKTLLRHLGAKLEEYKQHYKRDYESWSQIKQHYGDSPFVPDANPHLAELVSAIRMFTIMRDNLDDLLETFTLTWEEVELYELEDSLLPEDFDEQLDQELHLV